MKFSYNWLKELVAFKESPAQLAEFLTMRVFEVEDAKKNSDDWTLDIKVLPNRMADASGHIGMAREIAALKNTRTKKQESGIREDKTRRVADLLKIKIESPKECPRYTARMITDVHVGPSPAWMRARLAACGLQSINNVVDAANYAMLETGQPLHVFDYDKLHAAGEKRKTLIVRRARIGEKMPALDVKTYALASDILVIADEKEPVAIAGIKGGGGSGVSETTRTIVIEAANFAPVLIRQASQSLALRTDASVRFEHGLDPGETTGAADRLATLIQKIAGGTILRGMLDAYPAKDRPKKILFRPGYAERLIGTPIPSVFYSAAFRRLDWSVTKKGIDFLVTPPSVRRDIEIEEDIIEEIARLFDYKNIKAKMPAVPLASPVPNETLFWEDRTRDGLMGAGFTESMLSSFTGDRELMRFAMTEEKLVPLKNPANPDAQYLVPRLAIKYVSSAAENLRNCDAVKIFGVGKSFREPDAGPDKPERYEQKQCIVALAQKGSSGEEEFYELKGVVEQLLESLGISDHWYDDAGETRDKRQETSIFHPYRFAEIKIGDEKIGVIGEIHPAAIERLKARARITVAEIDMAKLTRLASAEAEYRPIGKYPAIVRDIAVVVPADTRMQDAESIIENAGGPLLADTDLFDYFQDDALASETQKSLAFHLVFQSPDRTLTDEEIDRIMKKVASTLEEKGWEVRK